MKEIKVSDVLFPDCKLNKSTTNYFADVLTLKPTT